MLLANPGTNTHDLVRQGWNVTYFDPVIHHREARIFKATLTEGNIASHFRAAGVLLDADYMSIDVKRSHRLT